MDIGVISDSHDQIHQLEKVVDKLNAHNVELVIHCGDWVSPFTLVYLKALKAPIKGIFGNNDGDKIRHRQLAQHLQLNIQVEERFLQLKVDNKNIAVIHGEDPEIVKALVTCGNYDLVLHGHTHQPIKTYHQQTLSLNPGSLLEKTTPQITGASFAIYNSSSHTASHHEL